MGFGASLGLVPTAVVTANKSAVSNELLHKLECRVCPLNKAGHLQHPKMRPTGSEEPEVYIIGEAPGRVEDERGEQFIGESGGFVRPNIPPDFRDYIRWNNTIRCRPSLDNRDPDRIEIEACRPSIERDIEQAKPAAIFGLGATPLAWAGKAGGIYLWRGRRFPIQVGSHVCWYYPMLHPATIIHQRNEKGWGASDDEFAFLLDLRRAFADVAAGLPTPVVHSASYARADVTCLTGRRSNDLEYLLEFLNYAGTVDVTGVDYETQNLRPYNKGSKILTAAVSTPEETVAFAIDHPDTGWTDKQKAAVKFAWYKFLVSKSKKASHQLSFEMEWSCFFFGRELAHKVPWEDTMTQAYVIDERVGDIKPGALSLEWLTTQHFGINIKKLSPKMNKENMQGEALEVLLPYNGIDAKYHRLVYGAQTAIIARDNLTEVYAEKVRQVPTVVLTQLKGIPVNPVVNSQLSIEYTKKLQEAKDAVQAIPEAQRFRLLAGEEFNPGSTHHVIAMLRDILKTREGQTGAGWSTKESVLSRVGHPITDAVLAFRKVQKLKSTYVDPYSEGSPVLYPGNIIHTNLGTCFTETGRLNSEDPNIQNVPNRTPEGKKARKQISSKVVASFDYGQIDARIIACGSRDKHYCKALWEDYDIHREWAERLAYRFPRLIGGKEYLKDEKVIKNFRQRVKSQWVFALFYGAALATTAGRFEVEPEELTSLYDEFWKQFADVKRWQDHISQQFKECGYVQLFNGLRRHAPLGRGQQINTPVQGATNRIVMLGMNRLSETDDELLQANMQIHDDLTFCFNSVRDYEDSAPRILDIMLDAKEFDWFCVPLVVELKDGSNWAEMEEIGVFSSVDRLGWPQRHPDFI